MGEVGSNPCTHSNTLAWYLDRDHKGAPRGPHALEPDSGSRVQGPGSRGQGSGFRGQGSGVRVQGSGFRVLIRVEGFGLEMWSGSEEGSY